MTDFRQLFTTITQQKVAVIGDVMLDTYLWGEVDRISPEAPVPVVSIKRKEQRIGGAGNVALNTVSLGAPTAVFSVVGEDDDAVALTSLFASNNIDSSYLVRSARRITTDKTRVISRNQQMLRLDAEITEDINAEEETMLLDALKRFIDKEKPSVVILEDYNKGVLTENVITAVLDTCSQKGIITTVDPKRKNFWAYKNATLFKPNLKEVKEALNILPQEISEPFLQQIHRQLHEKLNHAISLITLSEKGIFYQVGNIAEVLPGHIRNIADVSGAGDTVIAVASLVYAATRDIHLSASMANLAGGLVCEEVGTAAINRDRLLDECVEVFGEK